MSQPDIREYLDKPSPCASDIDAQLEAEEKLATADVETAKKAASDKELAEHRADDTLATVKTLSQLAADPAMAPLPMNKMLSEQSPSTPKKRAASDEAPPESKTAKRSPGATQVFGSPSGSSSAATPLSQVSTGSAGRPHRIGDADGHGDGHLARSL